MHHNTCIIHTYMLFFVIHIHTCYFCFSFCTQTFFDFCIRCVPAHKTSTNAAAPAHEYPRDTFTHADDFGIPHIVYQGMIVPVTTGLSIAACSAL